MLEEIARGGMGVVYMARQQIGGGTRVVALKMLLPGGHFKQAANTLRSCGRPGHGTGTRNGLHSFRERS